MNNMMTFQPIKIKNMLIRNRTFMPAMGTLFGEPETNKVSERMKGYIETRAQGGVGLMMVEYSAVMPSGRAASMELGIWDDRFIPGLAELAELAHKWGAKVGIQLHHAGRSTSLAKSGFQPVAPTGIANPLRGSEPRELKIEELPELRDAFAAAALRAKKAGYDCVEIHGAHGYLLSQFLSPFSNKRSDAYGGSFENRMRFPLEVLAAVREAVGAEFPISFRFSSEEYVEGGLTTADAVRIAQVLEEKGVDILNVSQGILDKPEYILTAGWLKDGFNENAAAQIKKHVHIPVITVGQYHSPELVEKVLQNGSADLVALGRALIVDPEFVNKMADGRWNEIRKCLHCLNSCYDEPVNCTQNPLFGHERTYVLKAALLPLNVVVVGAGPAGLQAAITAAERCHKVQVYEKNTELGGQVVSAGKPPGKQAFQNVVDYRRVRLERLRVPVTTGKEITVEDIRRLRPDAVIVATGSVPIVPPVKGVESAVFAQDVLNGAVQTGKKIVVVGGGSVGAETAEFLLDQDKEVTIVEMLSDIAVDAPYGERVHLLEALNRCSAILTDTTLQEIDGKNVQVKHAGEIRCIENVDTVVLACGARASNLLADQIAEQFPEIKLYVIGDAQKARRIEHAVKEGFLIGYSL